MVDEERIMSFGGDILISYICCHKAPVAATVSVITETVVTETMLKEDGLGIGVKSSGAGLVCRLPDGCSLMHIPELRSEV